MFSWKWENLPELACGLTQQQLRGQAVDAQARIITSASCELCWESPERGGVGSDGDFQQVLWEQQVGWTQRAEAQTGQLVFAVQVQAWMDEDLCELNMLENEGQRKQSSKKD